MGAPRSRQILEFPRAESPSLAACMLATPGRLANAARIAQAARLGSGDNLALKPHFVSLHILTFLSLQRVCTACVDTLTLHTFGDCIAANAHRFRQWALPAWPTGPPRDSPRMCPR